MSKQSREDQPRANLDGKVNRHIHKGNVPVGSPAGSVAPGKRRKPEGS